jgi:hypothetical protein
MASVIICRPVGDKIPFPSPGTNQMPFVGALKHVDAITSDRVADSGIPVLFDESKEFAAPWIIDVMEDLIAKFFQFFDTGSTDRFRDGFAPLLCDAIDVDLIEWHRVSNLLSGDR